jgi:hypothetical protein
MRAPSLTAEQHKTPVGERRGPAGGGLRRGAVDMAEGTGRGRDVEELAPTSIVPQRAKVRSSCRRGAGWRRDADERVAPASRCAMSLSSRYAVVPNSAWPILAAASFCIEGVTWL